MVLPLLFYLFRVEERKKRRQKTRKVEERAGARDNVCDVQGRRARRAGAAAAICCLGFL
ncbi:hypothetical protein E1A91_D01G159900v1 [Gossypium mustelinum]|uniref:Uncharacterized protein n=1 Tax=Gossypium mustelinum TaxID=34275 RepID=A0A5D2W804_GOSMU|nr:hypothetical protein E1A91_D01G159900v1 [Gossypium mustelinum]